MKTMKLGSETGSLMNHLMGSSNLPPVVGKGATILHWTDRSAYEVIEVTENGKRCKIQRYNPERVDENGMSESQSYKYEKLTDEVHSLVFRNDSWHFEKVEIVFTKEFLQKAGDNYMYSRLMTPEQKNAVYGVGDDYDCRPGFVVDGITRQRKVYPKVNIIFGVKREYYDYSF